MATSPNIPPELEAFTPPTLTELPDPPIFLLRPADGRGREWRTYQHLLRSEGLRFHSAPTIRAEVIRAVEALYDAEQAADVTKRLQAAWALTDKGEEVEPAEAAAIDDLVERLTREWRPLSAAGADNMRFQDDALRIALSMFLMGWRGIDLPYRRVDGRAPLELLDQLETKLEEIDAAGLAFAELTTAAYRRLRLEEEQAAAEPTMKPAPTPAPAEEQPAHA
ncbi:MAG TPA: hypothetical protein VGB70_06605 [Allosphingosinicella sp.]|jgi:hypothetical protein